MFFVNYPIFFNSWLNRIMNLIILLVIILVLPSGAYPQGFSPSRDASSACRTVQPAGAWRDCVERYDKKVQSLKEDPAYQEDLRLKKQQVEMDGQRIELEKQRIDSEKQQAEEQRRVLERVLFEQRMQKQAAEFNKIQYAEAISRRDSAGINHFCR